MSGFEERYFIELDDRLLENPPKNLPPDKLSSTPERWAADVRAQLAIVATKPVGHLLLKSIWWNQTWVRIQPYSPYDSACGASARWDDTGPMFFFRRYGSLVSFSPEKFAVTACAAKRTGAAAPELHETLFHELVHAFRQVSHWRRAGITDLQRIKHDAPLIGGLRKHDNLEEFIAVLVTNIYRSANGKRVLRASHHGFGAMDDDLAGSFAFYQAGAQVFPLIDEFCTNNKGFTRMLAKVDAPFNPIRAYYRDPDRARRLSKSRQAGMRDWVGDNPMGVLQPLMPWVRP
jgi:hypothetical protein